MAVYGADVRELQQLARVFQQRARELEHSVIRPLDALLLSTHWAGPDSAKLRQQYRTVLRCSLMGAVGALNDAALKLRHEGDQQQQASRAMDVRHAVLKMNELNSVAQPALLKPEGNLWQDAWQFGERVTGGVVDFMEKYPSKFKSIKIDVYKRFSTGVSIVGAGIDLVTRFVSREQHLAQDSKLDPCQRYSQSAVYSFFKTGVKFPVGLAAGFAGNLYGGPLGGLLAGIAMDELAEDYAEGVGRTAEAIVEGSINASRFFLVKGSEAVGAGADWVANRQRDVSEYLDNARVGAGAIARDPQQIISSVKDMTQHVGTEFGKQWKNLINFGHSAGEVGSNIKRGVTEAVRNPKSLLTGARQMASDGLTGMKNGFQSFSIKVMDGGVHLWNKGKEALNYK